jgi:putative MATE family efflux protein
MTVALFSGFSLLLLGNLIAKPILTLMGAPDDVISLAVLYLRIYFCGMPAMMVYNFGSAVLRSRGDSRRPFGALTFAGVLNVLLNLLFVIGLKMSVAGVALATVISNYISGGLILYFLTHEEDEFRLDFRKLTIRREYLRKMMYIGVPAGLQGMVFSLSNVVIQSAVNSFGADCIAGMTAAQNFDFISYCLLNAFAQTCVTFTSQNYGAGDASRCRRVWQLSMGIGLSADLVLIAAMFASRNILIQLFTTDAEVIRYAMYRIRYAFVVHFLCGTYEITAGALRGMNRSMVPAVISIVGTCAFRLLYVFLVFPHFRSPGTLMLVYPLSWILTAIAMNTAYFIAYKDAFSRMRAENGTI